MVREDFLGVCDFLNDQTSYKEWRCGYIGLSILLPYKGLDLQVK